MSGKDILSNGVKGQMKRIADDGRIALESVDEATGEVGAATCLVCRAGVSGWLRVYT